MPRKIEVEIKGVCSLIQHKMPIGKDSEEYKKLTEILRKDSDNAEAYTKQAELSTYKDSKGKYCIPAVHLEGAIIKAGPNFRVEGKGKKTYKDYMKAFIIFQPNMIVIEPQKYILNRTFVRIGPSRILRTRPEFEEGWTAKFTLIVLDDTIPLTILKDVLEYAGQYVGIGDWRPKYGRFEVTLFREITK
jgi:hypothetical protein